MRENAPSHQCKGIGFLRGTILDPETESCCSTPVRRHRVAELSARA